MRTLAQMIRTARESKGWTQTQLGLALGVPTPRAAQVTISRYECGVMIPQRHLGKLIKVLKLSSDAVVRVL